jgi:uncharacterized membrane protein YjjP (DUF1212 family)
MQLFMRYLLTAIIGFTSTGTIPVIAGDSWQQILATGLVGIVVAVIFHYLNPPKVDPKV